MKFGETVCFEVRRSAFTALPCGVTGRALPEAAVGEVCCRASCTVESVPVRFATTTLPCGVTGRALPPAAGKYTWTSLENRILLRGEDNMAAEGNTCWGASHGSARLWRRASHIRLSERATV